MKFYYLLILMLVSISVSAQNLALSKILNNKSTITDTIFSIKSPQNETVDIPITIITGEKKGPTFTIIAGIHGMEYPTIMSLLELRKEIDPKTLKGNLIIIPIVNTTSFYNRTPFLNPIDNLNLNRVFPGNSKGSITEVMADFITTQIFPVTDVLLDMHGGDVSEDLLPFICYYDNKEFEEQTKLAAKLCEISGFEVIVSYPYILPENKPAMYAFKQAVRQGITSFSIEIGKLGNWNQKEISFIKEAIYRIMNELEMYQNELKPLTIEKKYFKQQVYIPVPIQGIFHSTFKAGDYIEKNSELGYIDDIFGNRLSTIKAPESGVILYKVGTPPVNKGETLFCIGF